MTRSTAHILAAVLAASACAKQAQTDKPAEPLPPVSASTAVDKAVATTGDVITYTVTVEHDAKIQVDIPEPGAQIAGLRIIDTGGDPATTKKGRTYVRRWYKLRADLVGAYILPPVTLHYRDPTPQPQPTPPRTGADRVAPQGSEGPPRPSGETDPEKQAVGGDKTVSTSEIFIEVKSVLPADGEAKDIRDLKPLVVPKKPVWPWLAGAGAIVFLGAGIGAWIWVRRRKRRLVVPPPPPHEIAFAALDALRNTDFTNPEAVRQYFYALSEVLRAYIEGRFTLNATDLTTEEILPRLADLPLLSSEQRAKLREFLVATDLVKYAQYQAGKPEIESAYERALTFVETTRPAEPQSTTASASP